MSDVIKTREELEQRFMASAITYFNEGEKLFRLIYIILMVQIILGAIALLASCILTLMGVGAWAAFWTMVVQLLGLHSLESR